MGSQPESVADELLELYLDPAAQEMQHIGSYELPAEYLRVVSPSAEVQGHLPSERKTVGGKRNVAILKVEVFLGVFIGALTGALVGRKFRYDIMGHWFLALASGLGDGVMANLRTADEAILLLRYHLDQLFSPEGAAR